MSWVINLMCVGLAGVFVPDAHIEHKELRSAVRKHALRPMRQRVAGRIALRHLLVCALLAGSTLALAAQTGDLGSRVEPPVTMTFIHAGLVFVVVYAMVLVTELLLGSVRHAGALARYAKSPSRRATNPARWWLFNMLRMVATSTPTAVERVAMIDRLIDGEAPIDPADRVAIEDALSKPPADSVEGRLDAESLRLTFGVASLRGMVSHAICLLFSFAACMVLAGLRWPGS